MENPKILQIKDENQEILQIKDKYLDNTVKVEKIIMEEIERIPRGNIAEARKWIDDHSIRFREIADEIYHSNDVSDAEVREWVLSGKEENLRKAAAYFKSELPETAHV